MKKTIIILLLIVAGWVVWNNYFAVPPLDKYLRGFQAIADSIFAPLDKDTPNTVDSIGRLETDARADLIDRKITGEEARVIKDLCITLKGFNEEREGFEVNYRGILSQGYDSFKGDRGAEEKRQFFMDNLMRKWVDWVAEHRRQFDRDLAGLREQKK